jgi:hypothetical protein
MSPLRYLVWLPLLLAQGHVRPLSNSSPTDFGARPQQPQAEWTVLVFMNGDNNLEPEALDDFAEMARAKLSPRVNVVLQLDRSAKYDTRHGNWQQTLRFVMKPGLTPVPANAIADLGEQNMGDPMTLQRFVDWGRQAFPARHTALVVWDHGQGYRFTVAEQQRKFAAWLAIKNRQMRVLPESADTMAPPPHEDGLFRSVSDDEQSGDLLYMREVQDALTGRGLSLIGFDACLMAMVEVAYGLDRIAEVLVGSEDLEPGTGWNYEDWISELVDSLGAASVTPEALGRILVRSYGANYGPGSKTTLSAVQLSQANGLGKAVSALGDTLRQYLDGILPSIISARKACQEYAQPIERYQSYHIDLVCFTEALTQHTAHGGVLAAANRIKAIMLPTVLGNWAGNPRRDGFGSHGLSIYFPASRSYYQADPYERGGYRKSNTFYPVEFVMRETWADFLHAYFAKVP